MGAEIIHIQFIEERDWINCDQMAITATHPYHPMWPCQFGHLTVYSTFEAQPPKDPGFVGDGYSIP
jgi:hypothetical protein